MGKLFLRFTSFILSLGMIVPYGAHAATGVGSGSLELSTLVDLEATVKQLGECTANVPAGVNDQSKPTTKKEWLAKCKPILKELKTSAKSAAEAAKAYKAAEGAFNAASQNTAAATIFAQGNVNAAKTGAETLGADTKKAVADLSSANSAKANWMGKAQSAAGRFQTAAKAWNAQTPPPINKIDPKVTSKAVEQAGSMTADVAKSQADAAAMKANLGKALVALGALAGLAGLAALGASLLGGSDDKKDEEEDEDEEEEVAEEETEEEEETEDCGDNATLEDGVCVVTSDDDTCYKDDGTTEDTTKVRNTKGVCVSLDSLCETGYVYNTTDKICKKSTCETGYTENSKGECVKSGTIDVGTADPIVGSSDDDASDDTQSAENKATRTAATTSSGSSSSKGAASTGSGSGSASRGFSAGGGSGSSGAGGSSAYSAGGGGGDSENEAAEGGKAAEVQYKTLKWSNPKKEKSLRDTLRSK